MSPDLPNSGFSGNIPAPFILEGPLNPLKSAPLTLKYNAHFCTVHLMSSELRATVLVGKTTEERGMRSSVLSS